MLSGRPGGGMILVFSSELRDFFEIKFFYNLYQYLFPVKNP